MEDLNIMGTAELSNHTESMIQGNILWLSNKLYSWSDLIQDHLVSFQHSGAVGHDTTST